MKIYVNEVNDGELIGNVYSDQLTPKLLSMLDLNEDSEFADEIKVYGEFSLDWEDGSPTPIIEYIVLSNGNKEIELSENDVDMEQLEAEILDKGDIRTWRDNEEESQYEYSDDN